MSDKRVLAIKRAKAVASSVERSFPERNPITAVAIRNCLKEIDLLNAEIERLKKIIDSVRPHEAVEETDA